MTFTAPSPRHEAEVGLRRHLHIERHGVPGVAGDVRAVRDHLETAVRGLQLGLDLLGQIPGPFLGPGVRDDPGQHFALGRLDAVDRHRAVAGLGREGRSRRQGGRQCHLSLMPGHPRVAQMDVDARTTGQWHEGQQAGPVRSWYANPLVISSPFLCVQVVRFDSDPICTAGADACQRQSPLDVQPAVPAPAFRSGR